MPKGYDYFIVTQHALNEIPKREAQTVLYPKDLILVNRGGSLSKLKESLALPCYAPSEILIITVTGDVLICCNDATRSEVMGNIANKSIEEIWFSERFVNIRELLRTGNRDKASPICKYCDDSECVKPGEYHYKDFFKR